MLHFFWYSSLIFLSFLFLSVVSQSDTITNVNSIPKAVVELNSANFESQTANGDWFIKFYAPWCGHCKQLEPMWEEVALELKGSGVNVGAVDIPNSKELGTRFEIKGFPTMKLLSKGKVYTYKGARSRKDFVEFAKGGFQLHESEQIPDELGIFGEIGYVFRHAYKTAAVDIRTGNYFTIDVFLSFLPLLFIITMIVIFFIPVPDPQSRRIAKKSRESNSESLSSSSSNTVHSQGSRVAPPTSTADSSKKSD